MSTCVDCVGNTTCYITFTWTESLCAYRSLTCCDESEIHLTRLPSSLPPFLPKKSLQRKIWLALYLLPVLKKKTFPADSFLLLDRCFLNVMRDMCLTHFTMVSCPPLFLFCLSSVLHSLLSFSLDDVVKFQRIYDFLFFLLTRQSLALCV